MDVRTLKDFEKEIPTKINHELEVERKKQMSILHVFYTGRKNGFTNVCERCNYVVNLEL